MFSLEVCKLQTLTFIFGERDTYVHVRYMLLAVRLSSVCDVGAPYSGG